MFLTVLLVFGVSAMYFETWTVIQFAQARDLVCEITDFENFIC